MEQQRNEPEDGVIHLSPMDVEVLLYSCSQVSQRPAVQRDLDILNRQPLQDAVKPLVAAHEYANDTARYTEGEPLTVSEAEAKIALSALHYVLERGFFNADLKLRNGAYGVFVNVRTALEPPRA